MRRGAEVFGIHSVEDTEPRIRLVVSGRVQGVGYRAWVVRRAFELGLRGWVRNCRDGSVEVEAAGPEEVLRHLRALLSDGPPLAHVAQVSEAPPRGEPLGERFEVR